jgi:cardiolipin synthase
MTTANKVTIGRILLIPIFIVEILYYFKTNDEIHRVVGLTCFAVASILDGVDGYIARRYNQRSELGAILDPLADKLLLLAGVVLLSLRSAENAHITRFPLWLTSMILSRDSLLLLGLIVITMVCGKMDVKPRSIGKISTVLLMVLVLWSFLKWNATWLQYLTLTVGATTLASGLLYLWDAMRQLSTSPKSLPTPEQ